jgi:hypothetical protein
MSAGLPALLAALASGAQVGIDAAPPPLVTPPTVVMQGLGVSAMSAELPAVSAA